MNDIIFETKCAGFKVTVYSNRVAYKFFFGSETSIPIKQIASVEVGMPLLQQVKIETTGGKIYKLVVKVVKRTNYGMPFIAS